MERQQRDCLLDIAAPDQVRDRPAEHHDDLAEVACHSKRDESAQVVVDHPTFLDSRHDGREVVVTQHHVGSFFGHVGAGDPHCDADVGALEGGGVVDAVTRHGHHLALLLEQLDDPQLVLG